MANYTIPNYPTRRLRYYNNQFLKEQDFIDDQAYQLSLARAHLRSLCVAGVCEGLTVRMDGAKKLQIAPGIAIDAEGRMIALDAEKPGPDASTLGDGEYVLHISFHEDEDVMAPPVSGGAQGNTRWTQRPALGATKRDPVIPVGATPLPAGALPLGTFTVAAAAVSAVAPSGRRYSGVRFPGPSATTAATATNRGDGSADGVLLAGDLTVRRDVAGGKIGPTLALTNGAAYPGGAGSGAALDFSGYDPDGNAPALRLQAVGDNAGSSHLTISTKAPGAVTNNLVERLRLTSDGDVGIGTTVPAAALHVNRLKGVISAAFNISQVARFGDGGQNSNMGIVFDTGATGVTALRGFEIGKGSQDFMIVRYDSAGTRAPISDLVVLSNGNVGIGTANPLSTLTVGGPNASLRIASGNENGYAFENDNADGYKLKLRYKNPTNVFREIMTFDYATGNVSAAAAVGIGISPGAALDVSASSQTWSTWWEAIRFSRPEHSAITHPGGKLLFGMHSDRNFYFADTSAGVYLATISPTNGGRLGIGTNGAAGHPLHVRSSTADWQARFENPSSNSNVYLSHGGGYGMHVRTDTAATNQYLLELYNATQGGSLFLVSTSGNVSIAKTLSVSGQISAPAGLHVEGAVAHIERDGAFYRNTDGQVYLTVDDNLYIRDTGAGSWAAHFDTNGGNLELKGTLQMGLPGGTLKFTNVFKDYVEVLHAGNLWGINKWLSQRAAKKNIQDLDEAIDTGKLYELRPVLFNWASDADGDPRTIGLIAEEVEAVLPQLVHHDGDGKPFSVDYSLLAVMLLNELKRGKRNP